MLTSTKEPRANTVHVQRMRESNGRVSYFVTLTNAKGQELTPQCFSQMPGDEPCVPTILQRAIMDSHEYADFLGYTLIPYRDPETGEIVEAEMLLETYRD